MLLTCGAFTAEGEFLELPDLDMGRLETAWQEAVFALYLAEEKITPEVVETMRSWPHSGFSVDQSVFLPAGDRRRGTQEPAARDFVSWRREFASSNPSVELLGNE